MATDRQWTIAWNDAGRQWVSKYRKFPPPTFGSEESAWGTKRIPKAIGHHKQLDAERWMISWYSEYQRTGGVSPETSKVVSGKKTLRLDRSQMARLPAQRSGNQTQYVERLQIFL